MSLKHQNISNRFVLISFLIVSVVLASNNTTSYTYCSTSCASSVGACYGPAYN
jgi:hypothetical protein